MEKTQKIKDFYKVPAGVVIVLDNDEKWGYFIDGPEHQNPTKEDLIINALCEEITRLKDSIWDF